MQKLKILFFKIIEPIFPYVRDGLLLLRIIRHTGRQNFPIGYLLSNKTAKDLEHHLGSLGFHKNKIAWEDDGEVLSMRKLLNFDFCYHLRLFADGEIRGHYERTVESNFIKHFFEIGMEQRASEFKQFVATFLAPDPAEQKQAAIDYR